MPGRPVLVGRLDHLRERLVARAPQLGGGGVPDRGAGQRMREHQPRRLDVERAAGQSCRGGLDRVQVLAVVERRDEPCDRGVGVGVRRGPKASFSAGVSGAHEPSSVPSSAPA